MVLAAESAPGRTVFVCGFGDDAGGARSWLVVDAAGVAVNRRRDVRDAVAIAALCEIAAEVAFPGDLDDLRSHLVGLRLIEAPEGIEEAQAAVDTLQRAIGAPPTVASPARLDGIGQAARALERALDPTVASIFTAGMSSAQAAADALWHEVERSYRAPLDP